MEFFLKIKASMRRSSAASTDVPSVRSSKDQCAHDQPSPAVSVATSAPSVVSLCYYCLVVLRAMRNRKIGVQRVESSEDVTMLGRCLRLTDLWGLHVGWNRKYACLIEQFLSLLLLFFLFIRALRTRMHKFSISISLFSPLSTSLTPHLMILILRYDSTGMAV